MNKHPLAYWKGKHFSKEHRKRISEAEKGRIPWNKGKKLSPLSEETKQKISKAERGKYISDETRLRISKNSAHSKPWFGKHLSKAHKEKISRSEQGKVMSEEAKRKIGEASKDYYAKQALGGHKHV